ncbi:choice-of-anchor R domain-containing protein [Rubellicoccus peritrichatus]|uniref:Choice-of-anchor R domain-containing protein n=1 Tax=Rubellicoccus peritrichatus TaxID=3080537 RepID=A0AAQ3QTH5_9BACT|nr:choice-of-anchor R domain-containing protein [Puniceicoccus sp. CR14]WOO43688.1 choice-of-anchor R domain-containing protein [Puniceicoccus sp. CR14]
MKLKIGLLSVGCAVLLASVSTIHGAIGVSNLATTSSGTAFVGDAGDFEFALGQGFTTGPDGGDYTLSSITVRLISRTGSPADIIVALYDDNSGQPGSLLETLTGAASPSTAGDYAYTLGSGFALTSDATYYVVLSAPGSPTNTSYALDDTARYSQTGLIGWDISDGVNVAFNGGAWSLNNTRVLKLQVDVTAVPEPSTYALICGVALLGFTAWRRRAA